MELTNNLETIRQICRVCLQKGDINIWEFKVQLSADETNYISSQCKNNSTEESPHDLNSETFINALQLLEIFNKTTDSLVLPDEFPFLCWQCLEDFRLCYIFYEKVNNSNMQLKKMYDEYLDQCIEEEHPVKTQLSQKSEDLNLEDVDQLYLNTAIDIPADILSVKSPEIRKSKRLTLDSNSSIVVAQFVPTAFEPPLKLINTTTNLDDNEEFQPPLNLHTVDYTTVEIRDVNQLASLETSNVELNDDTFTTTPPVYVCQYCPQAFAKSEFLKTHVQRNHVCKFCMQTFEHYNELCQHLRQHKDHKCVICDKILSSQTNLRHHIKRIHRITLPPKITLLDFTQSKDEDDDTGGCLFPDALPEMLINDISDQEECRGYEDNPLGGIMYISETDDVEELINADEM